MYSSFENVLPQEPWLIIGDLNLVFDTSEKYGGHWDRILQHKILLEWEGLVLLDLGFIGEEYAWSNKQDGKASILARLDRACGNPKWTTLHPFAKVIHLDPSLLDHVSILLDTNPKGRRQGNYPFKFQNHWVTNEEFHQAVANHWSVGFGIPQPASLSPTLCNWNKKKYGHLDQ